MQELLGVPTFRWRLVGPSIPRQHGIRNGPSIGGTADCRVAHIRPGVSTRRPVPAELAAGRRLVVCQVARARISAVLRRRLSLRSRPVDFGRRNKLGHDGSNVGRTRAGRSNIIGGTAIFDRLDVMKAAVFRNSRIGRVLIAALCWLELPTAPSCRSRAHARPRPKRRPSKSHCSGRAPARR